MSRRKIINEALMDAKEIENEAEKRAKMAIVETFQPAITEFLSEAINSGEEDYEESDINEEWEAEHGTSSNRNAKAHKKDGWDKVHDGKWEEDPGENEETQPGTEVANKTGGGATKPPTSDPGKSESLPGEKVANKTNGGENPSHPGDPGSSEEKISGKLPGRSGLNEEEYEDDEELDMDIEDDEDVFEEEYEDDEELDMDIEDDEEGVEDEELEIPDELFQDEEDEEELDSPEDEEGPELEIDDTLSDEDDEEIDFELEDDPEDEEMEEMEEGLYLKKEGKFIKVSPAEALKTRIGELEEENMKLKRAYGTLSGELKESHLFNAKIAHVNKLYLSGMFSAKEKLNIAERIDQCNSIEKVKETYSDIITEAKGKNPLDSYGDLISEARHGQNVKKENIFESEEVKRYQKLAGIIDK